MKLMHISDSVHRCDCCGQSRQKLTATLLDDEGRHWHYALSCAARVLGLGERQFTPADAGTLVGLYEARKAA